MSDKQIRFGGHTPFPRKELGYDDPVDGLPWYRVLEQAFFQVTSTPEGLELYGDPNVGATLEQAWRTCMLVGGQTPVCLLSTERESVPTTAIDTVIKLSPHELVLALGGILRPGDLAHSQIFTHDGVTGHSVLVNRFDAMTSRFVYHDPWPGSSLLCKQNNRLGIDAKPDGARDWSISSDELEKVILAAFVNRYLWAEHNGEKYFRTHDELRKSEFWSFFHLTETESRPMGAHDSVHFLHTGGFQSEVKLNFQLNRNERLRVGRLSLKRSWVAGPPFGLNPFALDIARSFLAAAIAPPDAAGVHDVCDMLSRASNQDYARELLSSGPAKGELQQALAAYTGLTKKWERTLPYSRVDMGTWNEGEAAWLQIRVTNDVT